MNTDHAPDKKTDRICNRIILALSEYAVNWHTMQEWQEKEDLLTFLTFWKNDIGIPSDLAKQDQIIRLLDLMSNLEIQQDLLRSRKNWLALAAPSSSTENWPPELTAIRDTIDAIQANECT